MPTVAADDKEVPFQLSAGNTYFANPLADFLQMCNHE